MLQGHFSSALKLAAHLHAKQTRKGTDIPFAAHLLAVASIVLEFGGNEQEAIAALFHDTLEDIPALSGLSQEILRADIGGRFGTRVLEIVEGCSDAQPHPGQQKLPWEERKRAYLVKIATADTSVRLVSAADKLHNARSVLTDYLTDGEEIFERFNGRRDGTLWYFRELVGAYQNADDHTHDGYTRLIAEFARTVDALERAVGVPG